MARLRLYLASRISNPELNAEIGDALRAAGIELALPQEFCPTDIAHERYTADVFGKCLSEMFGSEGAIVNLDSCGKDSSWECGWFVGAGKPVIGVVQATTAFLKDFMLKGGLSGIATPNAGTTGAALCANPAAYYVNYHTTAFAGGAIRGQLH